MALHAITFRCYGVRCIFAFGKKVIPVFDPTRVRRPRPAARLKIEPVHTPVAVKLEPSRTAEGAAAGVATAEKAEPTPKRDDEEDGRGGGDGSDSQKRRKTE